LRSDSNKYCVIIPYYNNHGLLEKCLTGLIEQVKNPAGHIILVDDGSKTKIDSFPEIKFLLNDNAEKITLLRHEKNLGISASRNTALRICRERKADIVIMIDSDCEPFADFISEHIRLHSKYPDAACIGGGIIGKGEGIWAKLDNVISWVHSMPDGNLHEVHKPYHLPTTNFSVKLSSIPDRDAVFNERLSTGEDALFIREMQDSGKIVLFSPKPQILHHDRNSLIDVIKHHYVWGHHQYFVQLGGDLSRRCFSLRYRIPFLFFFLAAFPFFALLGSILNIIPWLKYRPVYILFYPFFLMIWIIKSIAVFEATLRPEAVLRENRGQ